VVGWWGHCLHAGKLQFTALREGLSLASVCRSILSVLINAALSLSHCNLLKPGNTPRPVLLCTQHTIIVRLCAMSAGPAGLHTEVMFLFWHQAAGMLAGLALVFILARRLLGLCFRESTVYNVSVPGCRHYPVHVQLSPVMPHPLDFPCACWGAHTYLAPNLTPAMLFSCPPLLPVSFPPPTREAPPQGPQLPQRPQPLTRLLWLPSEQPRSGSRTTSWTSCCYCI
jgi:hypothetical protein